MSYEFSYYIIYAAFIFNTGWRKWIFPILIALIVGIKIIFLFPIWLLGVVVYRLNKSKIKLPSAMFIFITTPLLYLVLKEYLYPLLPVMQSLRYSQIWIWDSIVGLLIALHISCLNQLGEHKYIVKLFDNKIFEKTVRGIAGISFSIYLYHFPLLLFWGAILKHDPSSFIDITILFLVTLLSIIILAQYTEKKKYVFKKILSLPIKKVF